MTARAYCFQQGKVSDQVVRPPTRGGRGVGRRLSYSPGCSGLCGFLKKVDSVNVTLLLILLYVDFLAFSPVRG